MTEGLLDAVRLGAHTARNRVVFGPHVTNLGEDRAISERHAAYYARRARGGCAVIVTEVASVHESDWPYERAPLASVCGPGWAAVAERCHRAGALVVAGIGHAGMQGSTTWSQDVLWAPSLVANVATHEQPIVMGELELDALVAGFASATALALKAGCDGVELNVGQHSLLRQFCSGLTNLRDDRFGTDRTVLVREVVRAVRAALGTSILGVRLCADELAPWAGITPADAPQLFLDVTGDADYCCVTRGSIFSEALTQPDCHVEQAFNAEVTASVASALRDASRATLVCAQGSIVDVEVAERLVASRTCDLVEMTRAQIADPDLCAKAASTTSPRVRPCLLCNQHCMVRDPRNAIVSCCVNPVAGHELDDAALDVDDEPPEVPGSRGDAVVVGGGVAGLEAARLLARRGHRVALYERDAELGGALRAAAALPGRARLAVLVEWLAAESLAAGVVVEREAEPPRAALDAAAAVVDATGGHAAVLSLRDGDDGSVAILDAAAVASGAQRDGDVVVLDAVGGPVGVGIAELAAHAGARVTIVSPDLVIGTQLAATGDLVAANERLRANGVTVVLHATPVRIAAGALEVEDRYTGKRSSLRATACVDAGHRVPSERSLGRDAVAIGDAVAPRGILMAMLEARRVAVAAP